MPRGGKRPGAGRPKGSPNKTTAEARAVALAFLDRRGADEIDDLWDAAKKESASRAMAMWMQAQEFVIPKLQRIEKSLDQYSDDELLQEVRRRKAAAEQSAQEKKAGPAKG